EGGDPSWIGCLFRMDSRLCGNDSMIICQSLLNLMAVRRRGTAIKLRDTQRHCHPRGGGDPPWVGCLFRMDSRLCGNDRMIICQSLLNLMAVRRRGRGVRTSIELLFRSTVFFMRGNSDSNCSVT